MVCLLRFYRNAVCMWHKFFSVCLYCTFILFAWCASSASNVVSHLHLCLYIFVWCVSSVSNVVSHLHLCLAYWYLLDVLIQLIMLPLICIFVYTCLLDVLVQLAMLSLICTVKFVMKGVEESLFNRQISLVHLSSIYSTPLQGSDQPSWSR